MRAPSVLRPAVVLCSAVLAVLVVVLGAPPGVRGPLVFWFVCVCPGLAWIGMLGIREAMARWTIAVAASLGLSTLVTVAMAFSRHWSATALLLGLSALSVAGAVAELAVTRRLLTTRPGGRPR